MLRPAAVLLLCLSSIAASAQTAATAPAAIDFDWPTSARVTADRATPLDRFVHRPDSAFGWKVLRRYESASGEGIPLRVLVLELTSQRWRPDGQADPAVWRHRLTILSPAPTARPAESADIGLLFITGGATGDQVPDAPDERLSMVAAATGSVVAELACVPNQPTRLAESDDPAKGRYEDDLLAASWLRFLETRDPTWLGQLPMTKSAIAAMTATTEALEAEAAADPSAGWPAVRRFTVSGASKRGWTTWLTAAVDNRVVAIAPIVIDLLNIRPSMAHHKASLGKWSEALDDYVRAGLADRLDAPESAAIRRIVDPYAYRDRLTMPKCLINAASDEFFLPDSSRYYFDDLVGEKLLSYTPNAGHNLKGSDALETLIAFHASVVSGAERPIVTWEGADDAAEHVVRCSVAPTEAVVWRATNPVARDFRFPILGPRWEATSLEPDALGQYRVPVLSPDEGYSATFARFAFDVSAAAPLRVSTPVWISPDVEPFARSAAGGPDPAAEGRPHAAPAGNKPAGQQPAGR